MGRRKNLEKEPVAIRFKELVNGNKSIYLDIYTNGKRSYEFLKMYLVPETGRAKAEARRKNSETMAAANAIKAQRVLDLKNGVTVAMSGRGKMKLMDWLEDFKADKLSHSRSPYKVGLQIQGAKLHLVKYAGTEVRLCDIDRNFGEGFIKYLNAAQRKRGGGNLKENTKKMYYSYLNDMLSKAVRDGILVKNPLSEIDKRDKPKRPESSRVYLDLDEVRRMAETDCSCKETKQAFMFSCFCGLRISDIRRLKWSDMKRVTDKEGNKGWHLSVIQQKTNRRVSFVLPHEALKWLPGKTDDERVFCRLMTDKTLNAQIKDWAADAGVNKHVTFHTARHTFGTMMITLGADLYTTSRLMGHSRIATTEIYAKIVDRKKDEAMGLIDKFFDG